MSKKYTEQQLQKFLDDYYNDFFLELNFKFIDHLDILQKEQAMLKNQYDFTSTISHQLRTPISVCLLGCYACHLKNKVDGDEFGVHESLEHLKTITNNLLFFLEIDGSYTVKNPKKFSLSSLVKENISAAKDKAKINNILIKYDNPDFNTIVKGDKKSIHKIIDYFLDNAIVYNKIGGVVQINISKNKNGLKFIIKDTGFGIPKDEQEKVFSKFFRATNASFGKNEGSGVSLYLAKMIIESHGGKIGFKSVENQGTTFYFILSTK